jgi:integrase
MRRACKAAGVEAFTSHALRYRAVIDLLDAGNDSRQAAEITGHSVETMLRVYRRVSTTTKRDAVKKARLGVLPANPGKVIRLTAAPKRGGRR